ncbi:formyltransferase family protein [uncultured Selenomonas sp.]|uniref:formyltransferase family protein n=1 Tax=uncultured Selenomonas sp. TaxID=159275 RepID=UPI0025D156A1|nr:formyltransferase family protein [uncultured Selenomonas sp.]
MQIVIVSNRPWNENIVPEVQARTRAQITYLSRREDVTCERLAELSPEWVFFPHWSYIIPADVYENFRCVIFHMTDLPYGRGGSPLQNLIVRGVYETQVTALRCVQEIDAGPVYMKRPLSLWGTAEEIYLRAAEVIKEMMISIVRDNLTPVPQEGEPVMFQRRHPKEGDLSACHSIAEVFDYIRMLDADGYPPAFLNAGPLHLAFSRASRTTDSIIADVCITMRTTDVGTNHGKEDDDEKENSGRSGASR